MCITEFLIPLIAKEYKAQKAGHKVTRGQEKRMNTVFFAVLYYILLFSLGLLFVLFNIVSLLNDLILLAFPLGQ